MASQLEGVGKEEDSIRIRAIKACAITSTLSPP